MSTPLVSGLDTTSFSSTINPGDDLFRYVNGPWIDTYDLPDDRSRYGAFDKLAEDAEAQIRDILEDENCPARKSQSLYRSFLDTDAINKAGITPIASDLKLVDGAQSKAELTKALGTLNVTGGPDLFDFGVYGDPEDPEHNILHIEQGGIGLPDEAYYRQDQYAPIREQYTAMVARLLTLAGYGDAATAQEDPQRLLDVETRIAANHWDNVATRDSQKTNNPTDFADLAATLAGFDITTWIDAWQQAYDASPAAVAQPIDLKAAFSRVIVHEPSFLTGLDAFWNQASLDELKLWARVSLISGWASALSSDFDKTHFDFYGRTLSGAKKQRDRWKRGVATVNGVCGEEVGREYVKRHFPESSKERMEQLVSNLIEGYRVSITDSAWLGDDTKTKALEKLSKFTPMIGYTNHWRDYTALDIRPGASLVDNLRAATIYELGFQLAKVGKTVDREEWLMNPQTVNAYYEPSMNVIVFPAAILQPPFFNPEADDAANYGGIGAVIGHEIGHGFDDQGSQYDGDGKLHDWWTKSDKANFEKLTGALIEQYNGFVPSQLQEKYADNPDKAPHVNGALTIGENIGDLSGVNISLKAYAFAIDKANGQPLDGSDEGVARTLAQAPTLDGFTGLQRFFLSYASIWRTAQRVELTEQYLQIDPHSPAEFRTNGIVRNVNLFYQAFDVSPEQKLWLAPSERVHIW
ncbi:M13-type metalloendopeptidase [Bifidobacterium sp. ESL0790]|uniref:M13 family metallopeptidase n=1 Tax=Bifidobacterium sp. ESL0790 TaxID=2983233 RepID=UPI0023F774A9|nr:M13-type metalloendopeptidase [Bifidobacterium sp. ESL0790]WEV71965.1 peptidase M13 [Bifidobacterium sp. ESL0790]